MTFFAAKSRVIYSHSIVPTGLLVTSYTTRFMRLTSLMIRVATRPIKPHVERVKVRRHAVARGDGASRLGGRG
jgi:hypothetical protein